MDSKYSAIGGGNNVKPSSNKRKCSIETIKIKKPKIFHHVSTEANGHNILNGQDQSIKKKEVVTEDLQGARKRLPVYMVRARWVFLVT